MGRRFDYTTWARKMVFKFPSFSYIAIQVNFWILAFLLLMVLIHFQTVLLNESYSLQIPVSILSGVAIALILGFIYGLVFGGVDLLLEKGFLRRKFLGFIILIKSLIYLTIVIGVTILLRYVLWDNVIVHYFYKDSAPIVNEQTWEYAFYMVLVYTLVMSVAISFINQMNKKFGPGILIPMLFGKYRNPKEEERVFMFLDLQSSTAHAEKLGHLKYSALIRDSFMDINQVLVKHNAEVYQYVGDEIVISWPITGNLNSLSCVDFFFACQDQFDMRLDYYMKHYGFVPRFKAGLHLGKVTAVEVGEIKRDIAYHGDTLNTASRIQSVCNQYDKIFLASGNIKEFADLENKYSVELIGDINLRGKTESIDIYSIDRKFV
ncbi:MAG: adenylate/guanylate cyclase domain-containing protein [Ignavibacterium sp.]|nr:MAG: adenylate/guanylate cyclase domain-containing protein [Ignavibacterium sp.]